MQIYSFLACVFCLHLLFSFSLSHTYTHTSALRECVCSLERHFHSMLFDTIYWDFLRKFKAQCFVQQMVRVISSWIYFGLYKKSAPEINKEKNSDKNTNDSKKKNTQKKNVQVSLHEDFEICHSWFIESNGQFFSSLNYQCGVSVFFFLCLQTFYFSRFF